MARLNRHYMLGGVDAVCADDQLTHQERALVVWPGVKKGVAAVIAQDVGSASGKARKAREYGIPVVGEGVLG